MTTTESSSAPSKAEVDAYRRALLAWAIDVDDTDPLLAFQRAMLHEQDGDYKRADEAYRTAEEGMPNHFVVRYRRLRFVQLMEELHTRGGAPVDRRFSATGQDLLRAAYRRTHGWRRFVRRPVLITPHSLSSTTVQRAVSGALGDARPDAGVAPTTEIRTARAVDANVQFTQWAQLRARHTTVEGVGPRASAAVETVDALIAGYQTRRPYSPRPIKPPAPTVARWLGAIARCAWRVLLIIPAIGSAAIDGARWLLQNVRLGDTAPTPTPSASETSAEERLALRPSLARLPRLRGTDTILLSLFINLAVVLMALSLANALSFVLGGLIIGGLVWLTTRPHQTTESSETPELEQRLGPDPSDEELMAHVFGEASILAGVRRSVWPRPPRPWRRRYHHLRELIDFAGRWFSIDDRPELNIRSRALLRNLADADPRRWPVGQIAETADALYENLRHSDTSSP
ncbi:MAG: hypothetical protein AAGD35_15685 [Actinomycetota bacterium]